jgi:uncharacterized membrane protein
MAFTLTELNTQYASHGILVVMLFILTSLRSGTTVDSLDRVAEVVTKLRGRYNPGEVQA